MCVMEYVSDEAIRDSCLAYRQFKKRAGDRDGLV